jgi:tetratricopeptide (TPR) repeat protein
MTQVRLALLMLAGLLALACPARPAHAETGTRLSIQGLFAEGNAKFRDALAAKDTPAARALFAEAIARWRAIIEQGGVRNAKLYANIGNACLLSGDTGRAVANFKRAQRLDAADGAAAAGLDAARRQAGSIPSAASTFWERALRYAGYLPRRTILGAFAALWIAGWGVLCVRIMGYAAPRRLGPALLVAGAVIAAPVVTAGALDSSLIHAVIVAAKAPAYNGPSDAVYQPTFKDGLPAGIEVRLLERRGEWRRVRLGDGRETWVRAVDIERI